MLYKNPCQLIVCSLKVKLTPSGLSYSKIKFTQKKNSHSTYTQHFKQKGKFLQQKMFVIWMYLIEGFYNSDLPLLE